MQHHAVGLLGEGHGDGGQHVVDGLDGLVGEVLKAPLKEPLRLGEALHVGLAAGVHHPLAAHHHAEEAQVALLGAGLDAVGAAVAVAQGPPGVQEVVGGPQHPLRGEVGGGDDLFDAVADGEEIRVFQGLRGDEVQVPGGGIVLGIMEPGGVHEVGVLAAQGLRLGVHLLHEGADGARDGLRQDGPRLVGGDDEKALEELPHRQDLPGLDPGGGAVVVEGIKGGLAGGDTLVHGELALIHRPEHQQGRHDLGEARGVELFVLILGVDGFAGVLVHQQGGLGLDVDAGQGLVLRRPCQGAEGQQQDGAEKSREKAAESHIHLSRSVV